MDSEVVEYEISVGAGHFPTATAKSFKSCVLIVLMKLKQLKDCKLRIDRTTNQLIAHTQELQTVIKSFHTDLNSMNRKQKIGQFVMNLLGTVFMKSIRYQLPAPMAFAAGMATRFIFGSIIATGTTYMIRGVTGGGGSAENYKAHVSPLETKVKDSDHTVDTEEDLYADVGKLLELLKELYSDPPEKDPDQDVEDSDWEKVPTPEDCIEWSELLTSAVASDPVPASAHASKLDSLNEKEYEILEPNVGDMISIAAIEEALKEVKQYMSIYQFYTLVWAWKYEDVTGVKMTSMVDDLHKKVDAFRRLQGTLTKVQIFKDKVCDLCDTESDSNAKNGHTAADAEAIVTDDKL